MATTMPANPNAQMISLLLPKIEDADPDFRFMALNDLLTVLTNGRSDILAHDYNTAARTTDRIVQALDDQNGEVQNQAIKCIGPLVKKAPAHLIPTLTDQLAHLKLKNSVDNAVPAMALKALVEALPRPTPGVAPTTTVQEAYSTINHVLIPRILGRSQCGKPKGGLLQGGIDLSPDSVDVIIEVVSCFGSMLQPVEVDALLDGIIHLLDKDHGNSVVKKRAVVAISMLARHLSEDLLLAFIQRTDLVLRGCASENSMMRRLYTTILGSMARSIPQRFGRHIPTMAPWILKALDEDELQAHIEDLSERGDLGREFDELREAALVALECFMSCCAGQMRSFTQESLQACIRYLRFDPNYAMDEDEDDEMGDDVDVTMEDDDLDDSEDFDDDDDDDDCSWKVRRCAAKTLYTIISTRGSGDLLESGVLYRHVAPALVKRFDEREENVRLEVLSAMCLLVRKTGEDVLPASCNDSATEKVKQPLSSRKRRRKSSDGAAVSLDMVLASDLPGPGLAGLSTEAVLASKPQADLAALTPSIIKTATKILKSKSICSKQAMLRLLDDITTVQRGGLHTYLDQIITPIVDAIKPVNAASNSASLLTAGGYASATASTLRIAALQLASDLVRYHPSSTLQPYLPKLVAGIVSVVLDRNHKLSAEAIQTAEEMVKAITPPRSRITAQKCKTELQKLYDVILDRVAAIDADAQVRQRAVHALGTLLSRVSSADGLGLLTEKKRQAALEHLLERLRNETTRLAAVRAVDTIAACAGQASHFEPQWVQQVALELAEQLRKANRSLRGSSVVALKHLLLSPATRQTIDGATMDKITGALIPVITSNDTQLLGPGLLVLAHIVKERPPTGADQCLLKPLCDLLKTSISGTVLESMLVLVTNIGNAGQGKLLMTGLLRDVGIQGEPSVVGKVIGILLVASGDTAGVSLDSFVQEVRSQSGDQARASLALAVLGEAAFRLGSRFPLPPTLFLESFNKGHDKTSLSAAVALGRAGAGNVATYVHVILQALEEGGTRQYLLLQSVRQILQQAAVAAINISQFAPQIWDRLLATAAAEDNKAVCAECLGRMVIIDPATYLPRLKSLLSHRSPTLRTIAVQALRYTLPDDNEAFDGFLKDNLVGMLKTILTDAELEIRRQALSTLASAVRNKPELILGRLSQLMPHVMDEAVVKPELIRQVTLGPFKHVVDDGLEVRKAAYETLYALLDSAGSRVNVIDLYNRLVEGLKDDNDVRQWCNLMITKLIVIEPDETIRRLNSIADAFRPVLSNKLKDKAVKQEVERHEDAKKAVLRLTIQLGDKLKATIGAGISGGSAADASTQNWTNYWEWVHMDFPTQLQNLRLEYKPSNI